MTDTLELSADETAAIKRMYCGQTGEETTALRYVDLRIVDTWKYGNVYLLVVRRWDAPELWGVKVRQVEDSDEYSDDLEKQERVTLKRAYEVLAYSLTASAVAR